MFAETSPWMTVAEAALYARRHPKTVLKALRRRELLGNQRDAHCTWRIHRDNVDRWIAGEKPARRLYAA